MATILIIDDDEMVRKTLSVILRHGGYEIELAENGADGLKAFREIMPDLVITDIIMPEKEGLETIMDIRRAAPAAKIIAISGGGRMGNADLLHMAKSLGAAAVIPKPFDPTDILSCVENCLAA